MMIETEKEFPREKQEQGEWIRSENCKSTDLVSAVKRIYQVASMRALLVLELGTVGKNPILLLKPKELTNGRRLLIAACFHGEEPAGCWGIIRFLDSVPENVISRSNLSFLPLVNPTGFRRGERTNEWGENPNKGFCHTTSGGTECSREGAILMRHLPMLKPLAKDGFLSLHEDIEMRQFYLYSFENTDTPGPFSETLRTEEAKFFDPCPDGIVEGGLVRNGIIFRHCDGSFEDLLFHEGIPRTACTETPGLLDIDTRVEANASLINALVRFVTNNVDK